MVKILIPLAIVLGIIVAIIAFCCTIYRVAGPIKGLLSNSTNTTVVETPASTIEG